MLCTNTAVQSMQTMILKVFHPTGAFFEVFPPKLLAARDGHIFSVYEHEYEYDTTTCCTPGMNSVYSRGTLLVPVE